MSSQDLIITTYNSLDYCNLLCEQIIYLSKLYNRIIIVDDNSNDNTFNFLCCELNEINNIKLVKNNFNFGPSLSRNLAINYSNAEYISFLDADDVFCNKKFFEISKFCNDYSPEIIFHDYKIIKKRVHTSECKKKGFEIHKYYLYLFKSLYVTPAFTIKRKIFLEENGYDNSIRYAEDLDLYIRLRKKYNFYFLKCDLVGIYRSQNSLSSNRRLMRKSIIKILYKQLSFKKVSSLVFFIAIIVNLCKYALDK